MIKPIIVVKVCYKLLYVIPADIKVFGRTYIPIYNAAPDWPRTQGAFV